MTKSMTLLITPLLLFSCQKSASFTYREWTSAQETARPAFIKNLELEKSSAPIRFKYKKIEYSRQILNGRPVHNSFLKKITGNSNEEIIQANYADTQNLKLPKTPPPFKDIDHSAEISKKNGTGFEKITLISKEESIVIEGSKVVDFMLIYFFDRYGVPYLSFFRPDGTLARTERQGSQFADINATIYADGPKLSPLSEHLLKGLSATPTLSNTQVLVTSESDKKIATISPVMKFDPKDDRFDQLQVFFYLSKSFQWMRENLQIEIPAQIEAVVHVGFPEKTNSAFYFRNKIRLGRGDDINYSNITHDASIVYHESFHALIDHLAHLPFEGEGGSLNEAFADFFTCLLTERPYLGESSYLKAPFKRTLQLNRRLDEKNGGLYHDSQIFSSLLWEVREKININKAKFLAVETLIRLNGVSDFADFNKKLLAAGTEVFSKEEQLILQQILKVRGFKYE